MKKPVPRDCPAEIDPTAGRMRLTTSSSDAVAGRGAGAVTSAGATDSAVGAASSSASGASTSGSDTDVVGRGDRSETATGAGEEEPSRMANITAIPPTTTRHAATRTFRRLEPDSPGSVPDGGGMTSSSGASGWRQPHLHSSTRLGTRRPHDGHVQERFGALVCSMTGLGDAGARETRLSVYGLSGNSPRIFR